MRGIFVTGTDTGIGKTVLCSLLRSALHQHGRQAVYFKPVQTGAETDRDEVARLTGAELEEMPTPVYSFARAAAPLVAARAEGVRIELDPIVCRLSILSAEPQFSQASWIVEGCGGLLVPLNSKESIRELVMALQLPLLIVASTRLGTLNHILLTVHAAQSAGIAVRGVVLVGPAEEGQAEAVTTFSGVPVLAQVPQIQCSPESVHKMGPEIFPERVLKQILL